MLELIQSLTSFKGDLSALSTPPKFLSTVSQVEFPSWWAENLRDFIAPTFGSDPEKRAVLVLKWYLGSLNAQFGTRGEKLGYKSPLNPFLGELFLGEWESNTMGTTQLISEQVCHHPPVTAYCIRNEHYGIRLQGYHAPKTSFSGTFRIKQIGHALLHLDKYDEDYLITLPSFHIKGLLTGNPYLQLEGATHIYSSTGLTSRIDHSGIGLFSGKKSSFLATLGRTNQDDEPLYSVIGQWTDTFTIKNETTQEVEICHTHNRETNPLTVAGIDRQDPWESRRAWANVTKAIRAGNMRTAVREKSKLEQAQREMRRKEKAEGKNWTQLFFTRAEDDPLFERLAGHDAKEQLSADLTGGVWRFDENKARRARVPYHEGLTPTG